MRGVTGFRMFDAVNGALAQLIPHRVPAAGEGGNSLAIFAGKALDGERFIYFELVVGTWGARPTADGNDGLCNPAATAANIPVEVAESEFPIRIERYGLVPDSGGPGRYRGGLAIERTWRTLVPGHEAGEVSVTVPAVFAPPATRGEARVTSERLGAGSGLPGGIKVSQIENAR